MQVPPLIGLRKEYYLLRNYMAGMGRRKIDLHGWAGISASGEVWLTHNACVQCPLEGKEEAKAQRKGFINFFMSYLKVWIFISSILGKTM